MSKYDDRKNGFSIVEVLVAVSIAVIAVGLVTAFARNMVVLNSSSQASLNAQLESRKILKSVISELRSASPSANGAYTIESLATSSIVFYADVNDDGDADRVRYYLEPVTRTLKRGVVLAAGSPASYNLGSEFFSTLISDVSNGTSTPIFGYYDENYAGTSTPLSYPVNISLVRFIQVTVLVDRDPNRPPGASTFTSGASLRNLKDNL